MEQEAQARGWRPPPLPTVVLMASVVVLLLFPAYHKTVVSADVFHWGIPKAWGPETQTQKEDGQHRLSFGVAERVDQGVSFLLQHHRTRRLDLDGKKILHMKGACQPGPCTVEVRVLDQEELDPRREGSWPWATFGPESTVQNFDLSAFGGQLARSGAVGVMVVRSEGVRKRDGEPRTRQLILESLDFR